MHRLSCPHPPPPGLFRAFANLVGSSRKPRLLQKITDSDIYAISYPLGNPEAVKGHVLEVTREAGYTFGFTMERAINNDFREPLFLARADCNDLNTMTDALIHA